MQRHQGDNVYDEGDFLKLCCRLIQVYRGRQQEYPFFY